MNKVNLFFKIHKKTCVPLLFGVYCFTVAVLTDDEFRRFAA